MSSAPAGPSVLMVHPGFLAHRAGKPLHGVELFNLALIGEMAREGVNITVLLEPFWREAFTRNVAPSPNITPHYTLPLRRPTATGFSAAMNLIVRRRKFDLLLIGNNGRAGLFAAKMLMRGGCARRTLLFAHQNARPSLKKALAGVDLSILAVSRSVLASFGELGTSRGAYYGVTRSERFFPRVARPADQLVHFGVLGQLDTPWKGAALAIEAWGLLPEDVRDRCRLHLCAYAQPPKVSDPRIVLHSWKPYAEVPEFLRGLDALIVPSTRSETFSQAMVQGMLTGLPILAYDLPVLTEKLDTGGGLVFRTPAELAGHVASVARDRERAVRMGGIGRETALQRYVWSTRRFVDEFVAPAGRAGGMA